MYGHQVLDPINSVRGVKQGDVLSPALFNLVMAILTIQFKSNATNL